MTGQHVLESLNDAAVGHVVELDAGGGGKQLGREVDDEDAKAARLHLMVEPTDSLTLLLTAELTKLGGTGPAVYGSPLVFDSAGDVVHDRPPLPIGAKSWSLGLPSGFMDATVKVVASRPAKGATCSMPLVARMISVASFITFSVRSSDDPGGSCTTLIR